MHIPPHPEPMHLRRRTPVPRTAHERAAGKAREHASEPARAIRCAGCGAVVTVDEHRISVDGAHLHTRTNPHGLRFTFACFRQAPGCRAMGPATAEWTWFPGHEWQVGVCAACGVHLGWVFRAPAGDTFHGLIADRIASGQ